MKKVKRKRSFYKFTVPNGTVYFGIGGGPGFTVVTVQFG